MIAKFTKEQKDIINSQFKRILVNSNPGTTKTTVKMCYAIRRAKELIIDNDPTKHMIKVLVISLTNYARDQAIMAAQEMINSKALQLEIGTIDNKDIVLNKIEFSTIHAFSFRMLRYYGTKHNNCNILSNEGYEEILEDILEETKSKWMNDEIKKVLLDIDYKSTNKKEIAPTIKNYYPNYNNHSKTIIKILTQLKQFKKKRRIVTFNDMIDQFHDLLKNETIKSKIIQQYPIIIVDEFQDTGGKQWNIIKKLITSKSYLLVSGDDGQTIFTWTGASFKRFKHFQQRYPKHKIYPLALNMRSTVPIVNIINGLLDQSHYATKKIVEVKDNRMGAPVQVICSKDKYNLYNYIINQIKKSIKEGMDYHQIAILYRFYKDIVPLKEVLSDNNIPFEIYGDKSKRDRPFVSKVFALIRIVEEKKINKEDWRTVLTKMDYIGQKKADKIIDWVIENNNSIIPQYSNGYKYTEQVNGLLEYINSIRKVEYDNMIKLKFIMKFVGRMFKINRSVKNHIRPTLLKLANETYKLSDIIQKYNDHSYPLCYSPHEDPPYPKSYVRLSNVHKSKGGGFDKVIYLGTDDMLFEKFKSFKTKKKREEELQLMNVAVSRAKQELHLLFPMDEKDWRQRSPIPNPWTFIANIDQEHYILREP